MQYKPRAPAMMDMADRMSNHAANPSRDVVDICLEKQGQPETTDMEWEMLQILANGLRSNRPRDDKPVPYDFTQDDGLG